MNVVEGSMICIVLKQTLGERSSIASSNDILYVEIARGELVKVISEQDRVYPHYHNYRKLNEPDVTFYNDGSDVAPLQGDKANYLLGIKEASKRIKEYNEPGRLKVVMELKENDSVMFHLGHGHKHNQRPIGLWHNLVRGIIKYIGHVPDYTGFMFGIEIMVST